MTGFGYNPKHTLVKIYKTNRYPCLFKPFNRAKVAEAVEAVAVSDSGHGRLRAIGIADDQ